MSGSPIVGNIALSLQAKDVCESHFFGGRGCGQCPIISACHSGPTRSEQDLWNYRKRLNEAAEKHSAKLDGKA